MSRNKRTAVTIVKMRDPQLTALTPCELWEGRAHVFLNALRNRIRATCPFYCRLSSSCLQ